MTSFPIDETALSFEVIAKPEPQGSVKAFVIPAKGPQKARAILTSDNSNLKGYRNQVTAAARKAIFQAGLSEPVFGKHVPVKVVYEFTLERPASAPRSRQHPVVRPDISKLIRATEDAMTGFIYADDAQIVASNECKVYGAIPGVKVLVRRIA